MTTREEYFDSASFVATAEAAPQENHTSTRGCVAASVAADVAALSECPDSNRGALPPEGFGCGMFSARSIIVRLPLRRWLVIRGAICTHECFGARKLRGSKARRPLLHSFLCQPICCHLSPTWPMEERVTIGF